MHQDSDSTLFRPRDVLLSLVLLTRLPLPALDKDAFSRSAAACWAYPVAGLVVSLLAGLVWALGTAVGMGPALVAGLSLGTIAMITGSLHEDGLADTADGLWGSSERARRLEIMKDSRIGSYGVLALIFVVGLRWMGLAEAGFAALVAAACLSRAILPLIMALGPYARPDGLARSVGQPRMETATVALGLGVLFAWLSIGLWGALLCLILTAAIAFGLRSLAQTKIGGVTGDILGATQMLTECAIFLAIAAAQ
ncbi:MAG: adenosylcobinamide-GDP ribazoletransferase [Mangrovicoccus sp.]